MKVSDILEYFLSRAGWVDRDTTVDRVIAGDPNADVDRCVVTWMPSLKALRYTVDRGVRLLICHEPTFWNHRDDRSTTDDPKSREKLAYIQDHDMAVLRNHDCWDRWPDVGIPWAWADFLGLGNRPKTIGQNGFLLRCDIEPAPLDAFAREVAGRCKTLGEPVVQVAGDASRLVSQIGVGTGCCCDIRAYRKMGCDCSIVCDDGTRYWSDIQRAADFAHPVIRVNHGTSEEPGMATLTKHINDHLDGLRAEHLPHGAAFRLVGAEGPAS